MASRTGHRRFVSFLVWSDGLICGPPTSVRNWKLLQETPSWLGFATSRRANQTIDSYCNRNSSGAFPCLESLISPTTYSSIPSIFLWRRVRETLPSPTLRFGSSCQTADQERKPPPLGARNAGAGDISERLLQIIWISDGRRLAELEA